MASTSAWFDLYALILLWLLSIAGGIAVTLSWIYVEPEFNEENMLTMGGLCSVRARALLTAGCVVLWICTLLGHVLPGPKPGDIFGFWQSHPAALVTFVFIADLPLVVSVFFAWQALGVGRWILSIASPIITLAAIAASFVLSTAAFFDAPSSW
jgi:hypothetical protein